MHQPEQLGKDDPVGANRERVLIIEDEQSTLDLLAGLLACSGFCVTATSSSEEALQYLSDEPRFDLVFSKLLMPHIDGLTLLGFIHKQSPGLPVVIVSSACDVQTVLEVFRAGAVDLLLTPFDLPHLVTVTNRAMHRGRVFRKNATYRETLEELIRSRTRRLHTTMQDLERSYDITLEVLGDALDLRDTETEGHARRVTAYSIALAREIPLSPGDLRVIARGAFLHDVGKIATPDNILLKPSALNSDEVHVMRRHCSCGYEMVRKIPFLRDAAEIVYAHHEAFDGSGYPRRLKGEEIPLGARIFAVADTLDAITSDRPYRSRRSFVEARAEIARCISTQFDPAVVEIFLQTPVETWAALREDIKPSPSVFFGLPAEFSSLLHVPPPVSVAPALYPA